MPRAHRRKCYLIENEEPRFFDSIRAMADYLGMNEDMLGQQLRAGKYPKRYGFTK